MPLDKLLERIAQDAADEAGRIESEAREKAEEALAAARVKAESTAEEEGRRARREAEIEKSRNIAMANLEVRKDILELKRSMIDRAFDLALQRLKDLPQESYLDLMKETLLSVVEEGGGEVMLSPRDHSRLGKALVDAVNRELKSRGTKGKVGLSAETRDIEGGFILSHGGVEINQSLESLLEAKKETLEMEVVSTLWG